MAQLTITLSDATLRALQEAAARRGRSPGEIIEESLEFFGIKTTERAAALVAKARRSSAMNEADALDLAVSETRLQRSS